MLAINFIVLVMAILLTVFCWLRLVSIESWAWDFDDFPDMCKRKMKQTEKDLEFANTPHFGGTPNNSQVWM